MIGLLIFLGYIVAWTGTSTMVARGLAEHHKACRCHKPKYAGDYCINMMWHWRGDGTVGVSEAVSGTLLGLAWPLYVIPASVWFLATRTDTPKGLQKRVAELDRENARPERELGIGGTR